MKNKIINIIDESLKKINFNEKIDINVVYSKKHGDFSTNIAMQLSKKLKEDPFILAQQIKSNIKSNLISDVEVVRPGFINIFLNKNVWNDVVSSIIKLKEKFGSGKNSSYINVEYVSANPTGYLHLGHARGAAVGSSLINILRFAGNKVDSEYYINDVGNQMDILGISVFVRYNNLLGNNNLSLPKDSYKGKDIIECAKFLIKKFGDVYKLKKYEDVSKIFKEEAKTYMLDNIKKHLKLYNVVIEKYISENSIYTNKEIDKTLVKLKKHIYEKDGAIWLKTTQKGDDKDRVLVKSNKSLTYFAPDLAYHNLKIERGYDELINIWGGDHIGYIKRMEIGLEYLGLKKGKLDTLVVQTVRLIENNKEFKMSKRQGKVITLEEIIKKVGKDAARWFMLKQSVNSQLIFNVDVALKKSNDNSIFKIQYTYARINQLIKKSNVVIKPFSYEEKQEIEIINSLNQFSEIILDISKTHKVHILTKYLVFLCSSFNSWYSNSKAIGHKRESSLIALALATKIVIGNGLKLLGISAPDKM